MSKITNYVKTIHNDCDRHDSASRASAQQRLRQLERQQSAQSARPKAPCPITRQQSAEAVDRLRSRGLIPLMRTIPNAKPLPPVESTTMPNWLAKCSEPGLAWILMQEAPTEPKAVLAIVRRALREERCGRVSRQVSRACVITRESEETMSDAAYRRAQRAYSAEQAERDRAAGLIDLASALPPSALAILETGGSVIEAATACKKSPSYIHRLIRRARAAAKLCRLA